MRNLRIGTKLMVSFGAIVLFLLAVAGFAVMSLGNLNDVTTTVVNDRIPKMNMANEMSATIYALRDAEAEHILADDRSAIAAVEKVAADRRATIEKDYTTLDPKVKRAQTRKALDEFKVAWTSYVGLENQLLDLSRANKNAEASALFNGAMAAKFKELSVAARAFADGELELADQSHADSVSAYGTAKLILGVVVAVALGGSAIVLVMLIGLIAKPLVGMTRAMVELSNGNMKAEVPVDVRSDEVGDLAKAMAAFRDQLRAAEESKAAQTELLVSSVGTGLERLAQGDLTVRIDSDLSGPFAKLKADFNNALEELSATLGAVSQASGGVHTGAGEISQASNDLSRRTEQQAASLEETAAAMDQITTTVREAAASAARANQAVVQARGEAAHSGEVVTRAIEAMAGIERASAEISEIITVIDGIAFQTNLLALNAGVEAARAGDAGKGFAVVASEVRALAQRSADAAKDVKARITASSEQVDAGVSLVSETGSALERIIAAITEVDGLVADIATSAEQQATGLQQVNTAVAEMDGVTQQNAAMVEEATAAARSLAAEADTLARQIGRFNLGRQAAAAPSANPVHQLQARASNVQRSGRPATHGNTALAVQNDDDWSEF